MPAARTVRLARRLAGGMTPAEVARHEGTDEAEILSLLEDEKFQKHVAYYRREAELPEDEREEILIRTAFASLQHLADMGDTKALLFLAYEGNRGRHPENRLRRLVTRTTDHHPELRAGDEIGAAPDEIVPASEPSIQAPKNPVAAELVSDLARLRPEQPGRGRLDPALRREPPRHAGRERGRGGGGAKEEHERREDQQRIAKEGQGPPHRHGSSPASSGGSTGRVDATVAWPASGSWPPVEPWGDGRVVSAGLSYCHPTA